MNDVDGHQVPVPHFGAVLEMDRWHTLSDKLRSAGIRFVIEPYTRFARQAGNRRRCFCSTRAATRSSSRHFGISKANCSLGRRPGLCPGSETRCPCGIEHSSWQDHREGRRRHGHPVRGLRPPTGPFALSTAESPTRSERPRWCRRTASTGHPMCSCARVRPTSP